jgi:hypothetical protein
LAVTTLLTLTPSSMAPTFHFPMYG